MSKFVDQTGIYSAYRSFRIRSRFAVRFWTSFSRSSALQRFQHGEVGSHAEDLLKGIKVESRFLGPDVHLFFP